MVFAERCIGTLAAGVGAPDAVARKGEFHRLGLHAEMGAAVAVEQHDGLPVLRAAHGIQQPLPVDLDILFALGKPQAAEAEDEEIEEPSYKLVTSTSELKDILFGIGYGKGTYDQSITLSDWKFEVIE